MKTEERTTKRERRSRQVFMIDTRVTGAHGAEAKHHNEEKISVLWL